MRPDQRSIFWYINDIRCPSPPLSENDIFPPLGTFVFWLLSCLFCLNSSLFSIYFTLLLHIFSFSFPLSPFFSLTFSLFSLPLCIFFPWITSADIFPSLGGGGYFSYIDPWAWPVLNMLCAHVQELAIVEDKCDTSSLEGLDPVDKETFVRRMREILQHVSIVTDSSENFVGHQLFHFLISVLQVWIRVPQGAGPVDHW